MMTSQGPWLVLLALACLPVSCSDHAGMLPATMNPRPESPPPSTIPDDIGDVPTRPRTAKSVDELSRGASPVGGATAARRGGPDGGGLPAPEPMTLLLVGSGMAATALLRRRRRAAPESG